MGIGTKEQSPVCRSVQTMFLNDFDLEFGVFKWEPLTFGRRGAKTSFRLSKDSKFNKRKRKGGF
ncbi:hypothetical protein X927_10395 [Petrotoga mexicana DSM 14811]|uniref:Uncharacterized protein n=1 Tax=Petrotoga mexicana DSM 14811 TaxID=1122954 RepID=A0A2K1P564_9BACT|nr:hypothetical protein X927_10395 [Petrotoga mexicana DSM 14811]